MGINGLSSFVRSKEALQTRRLCRCRLLVDGTNLCHFLYKSCKAGWRYGGDYDKFAQEVREVSSQSESLRIQSLKSLLTVHSPSYLQSHCGYLQVHGFSPRQCFQFFLSVLFAGLQLCMMIYGCSRLSAALNDSAECNGTVFEL